MKIYNFQLFRYLSAPVAPPYYRNPLCLANLLRILVFLAVHFHPILGEDGKRIPAPASSLDGA